MAPAQVALPRGMVLLLIAPRYHPGMSWTRRWLGALGMLKPLISVGFTKRNRADPSTALCTSGSLMDS